MAGYGPSYTYQTFGVTVDIHSARFKEKTLSGAEKTGSVYQALSDFTTQHPILTLKGGLIGEHLLAAYGHKVPVLGKGLSAVAHGTVHAGLQHGIRGEKPLSGAMRFGMAVMDPHMKNAYEMAYEAGKKAKELGATAQHLQGTSVFRGNLPLNVTAAVDPTSRVNRAARALTTHYTPKELAQSLGGAAKRTASSATSALRRFVRE